jgi:hypothetical protein
VPLTNDQASRLLYRVHRLVRIMGAMLTVVAALVVFQYIQQNNLADDQATSARLDEQRSEILHQLDLVLDRVDVNTEDVAAYVKEIRARAAAQGGSNPEVARRLILIDRIAALLEQVYGPLPEAPPVTTGG